MQPKEQPRPYHEPGKTGREVCEHSTDQTYLDGLHSGRLTLSIFLLQHTWPQQLGAQDPDGSVDVVLESG